MKFAEFLNEGVYDPAIFKAIFLAGGPGSGKSFVAQKTTTGLGLKIVNSDVLFEKLAKEANYDLKNMEMADSDAKERGKLRDKAKDLTAKQMQTYINGRIGLVIDGTGRDYNKIKGQRIKLEKLGYDTFMIFVNTTLQVAHERNKSRKRNVPSEFVEKAWGTVQENIGVFQTLFGIGRFRVLDNNVYIDDKNLFSNVWKEVMKFAKKPIENYIARNWIDAELEKRKRK